MRKRQSWTLALRAALALLLLVGMACSTDSPSEPRQNPQSPSQPSATWSITVISSSSQIGTGNQATTITITVRNATTNVPPPDGSTVSLTTSLGEFGDFESGLQAIAATLVGGQTQVLLFGGDLPGTATVSAQLESSIGRVQVLILSGSGLFLDRVVPNFGSPQGDQEAEIFGGGFVTPVRVLVGGRVAEVLEVEENRIRVRIPAISLPAGQTQTVNVQVTVDFNGENEATDTLPQVYTYSHGTVNQPVITSITPQNGPNEGGTRITILGDGFESDVQVLFGQGAAGSFTGVEATVESVTRTQIVVRSPPATAFGQNNLNQRVNILVRNLRSGLAAVEASAFLYGVQVLVTGVVPNQGPDFGGQQVTLFGQGFDEPPAVSLAGFVAQVVSVTGTEVVVRSSAIAVASCTDVEGPVLITNLETGNSNDPSTAPSYIYRVPSNGPSILDIDPNSGSIAGGTTVTITGTGFRQPLQVFFGEDRPGNIQSVSPNQIVVLAPFFPERSLETESCDDNADGTEGERFIPTAVDVMVVSQATTCEANFVEGFFYTPTNTSCRNDVGPVEPEEEPSAEFEFVTGSVPLEVIFTATDQMNVTTYSWTILNSGGMTIGTSGSPSFAFTFPAAGTYTVTLTVVGPGGTDSNSQTIVVPLPP
jgi:PKD repeat protein